LELHGGTPEELGRFVASESEKWRTLIKNADIKAT
jgi:tripartite-type tricarboxylate transporter receptor subunit TctC